MPSTKDWDSINDKIIEVTKQIQESGLTMVSGTFGTNDGINNWQYKIWIPKSKIKRITKLTDSEGKK